MLKIDQAGQEQCLCSSSFCGRAKVSSRPRPRAIDVSVPTSHSSGISRPSSRTRQAILRDCRQSIQGGGRNIHTQDKNRVAVKISAAINMPDYGYITLIVPGVRTRSRLASRSLAMPPNLTTATPSPRPTPSQQVANNHASPMSLSKYPSAKPAILTASTNSLSFSRVTLVPVRGISYTTMWPSL
jgi:hypothetical protein